MAKMFDKEVKELARIIVGMERHLQEKDPALDKQLPVIEGIFSDFMKKYPKITIKIEHRIDHLPVHIYINEQSIKKVFEETCAKIKGLASIGVHSFDEATLQDGEKFAALAEKAKDTLFLTYVMDFGTETIVLKFDNKENKVELVYELKSLANKFTPQYILFDKYASKESGQNMDILSRCYSLGFADVEDTALFEWEDENYPRLILG